MSNCRPLYKKYPLQYQPQDAYLEIDKNGDVSVDYSYDIGNSIPMDVFNGSRLWFYLNPYLSEMEISRLVAKVKPLAAELHEVAPIDWDERCNKTRTKSPRFYEIVNNIEKICDSFWGDDEPCYSDDCDFCSSQSEN